jgi:hypothetical protein
MPGRGDITDAIGACVIPAGRLVARQITDVRFRLNGAGQVYASPAEAAQACATGGGVWVAF